MSLDELNKKIREVSDEKLNETISKGALRLSDEQTATVSFAFWLVYMAETDLNTALAGSWGIAKTFFSAEVQARAEQKILELIGGKKMLCQSCGAVCGGRDIDISNPEYFSDKIKIYQALFGKTERARLLWKLNDMRNDLSHNRIEQLKYGNRLLAERAVKENVLLDYFRTAMEGDFSESEFWKSLSEDDRNDIQKMFEQAKQDGEPESGEPHQ